MLFGERVGHAPLFLAVSQRLPVFQRRTFVWVALVSARVLHAPPSGLLDPIPPLPAACLGGFCLSVVCFFFFFLGSHSACVEFKFYGNICWLIARSGLFSLESER
jgi:hypothetical protein